MHDLPLCVATLGFERCDAGDLPRHRHADGYMTLILRGGYVEAGDAGRFRASEGNVLIHRAFEAHKDRFGAGSADVINLPLPATAPAAGMLHVADPDAIARLAESDTRAAAEMVCVQGREVCGQQDWPDLLAEALRRPSAVPIGEWARNNGLAPGTVSRGFQQLFGTTPARYRAEARARLAWRALSATHGPLADLAFGLGFADQAHMTRSVRSLTGRPPRQWRQSINPVQDPPEDLS